MRNWCEPFAFEEARRVDHMLDDAGTGDLTIFGDVADEDDCCTGLWRNGSAPAPSRAPESLSGRRPRLCLSTSSGWIDDDQRGVLPSDRVAMMSSTAVSAASSTAASRNPNVRAPSAPAPPLLAGDIDGLMSCASERRWPGSAESTYLDAGIAADQSTRGAAHKAAPSHAVEFGNTRGQTRGVMRPPQKRLQHEKPAFARPTTEPCRTLRTASSLSVFHFSAGFALAPPAAEARRSFGKRRSGCVST